MRTLIGAIAVLFAAPVAVAQPDPSGIDFVTIGAPGNRAYDRQDPFNLVAGRGAVGYEYRIGRTEVTTGQWLEFFNALSVRPDPVLGAPLTSAPILWGGQIDPTYSGPGTRYRLNPNIPNAAMLPVGGISWRQAAVLCNWLHNDKSTAASAFLDGAYNVATFGSSFPTFPDQQAHHAGARYWIPTLDEWMKAVHYDPSANGGLGKWWEQPNGSDVPLTYGPPPSFGGDGTGQANAGFRLLGNQQYLIPLGSYSSVQSPWGLLDVAGGTAELLESIRTVDGVMSRGIDGSAWGTGDPIIDVGYLYGDESPGLHISTNGFRIASTVPAPSTGLLLFCAYCGVFARLRQRESPRAQDIPLGRGTCPVDEHH